MQKPRVEKGYQILYDAKSGEPFKLPVGSPWEHYVSSGRFVVATDSKTLPGGDAFSRGLIRQGAWSGRPAYIIGGGPSLRGFDFASLRGHLTIGVNRAFEFFAPSIFITLDYRYLRSLVCGGYGAEAQARFQNLKCPRVIVHTEGETLIEGVSEIGRCGDFGLSEALSTGVFTGKNSGFAALNLAYLLGANPIYLLGFDMGGQWHHSGHPWPTTDESYSLYRHAFEVAAEPLQRAKVHVVNLCPTSALQCFEKAGIEVPAAKMPTFVSYHTDDEIYRGHADRLRRSLVFHGIPHIIRELPSSGTWEQCAQRKATFLAEIIEEVEGPIVWTDADSTVERYPALFEDIKGDVAFHMKDGKELLSGTVYFSGNARSKAFIRAWIDECAKEPQAWDQHAFQRVVTKKVVKGLKAAILPAEYVCINDSMRAENPPVILHWQASREARKGFN